MTGFLDRLLAATGMARPAAQRQAQKLSELLRTLISERGEASGAVLARKAVGAYGELDAEARLFFFESLAREFAPSGERVLAAATAYHAEPTAAHLARLQREAEPARQEVFRRMNMAPGGTAALLELRRALLEAMKAHPELAAVDHDLTHLLGSWFNRGFLELRRIGWDTPAAILEKLIAYEAVHEIKGFPDLKRRLQRDRRCFAFFHPVLPHEPLIFVEVAFVDEIPAHVAPILAMESEVGDPQRARCAVFYSITSCQPGLRGISFGNFLIKQVAADLKAELPKLKTFATLSPVPGLRAWVRKSRWLDAGMKDLADSKDAPPEGRREVLEAAAARYLTREWEEGQALDPVARFHLGNGARLERINWAADLSPKGLKQSFGLMVNYVYDLDDVEANHEEYVNRHRVVCSGAIERKAKAAQALLAPAEARQQVPAGG